MGAQNGKEGSVAANTSSPGTAAAQSLHSKGIRTMDPAVAKKLQSNKGGINYNLRVVIRGDREVGKSTLLKRLEGGEFNEKHLPTPQIQTAHINWNYKTTNEVVMVEVWDVVDSGIASASNSSAAQPAATTTAVRKGSQIPNPVSSTSVTPILDANFVDVYQNSHAVILLVDPTREWTLDYVKKELPKIPKHLDILILVNFRDVPTSQRVLTESHMEHFMRTQPESVKYLECSLKNGFGLRHFYNFLNVPFLKLKSSVLQQQLKQTRAELQAAEQEVQLLLEQDYDSYLKWLAVQVNPDGKKEISVSPSNAGNSRRNSLNSASLASNNTTNSTASSKVDYSSDQSTALKLQNSALTKEKPSPNAHRNSLNESKASTAKPALVSTEKRRGSVEKIREIVANIKISNNSNDVADNLDDFNPGASVSNDFFEEEERPKNKEIEERRQRTQKAKNLSNSEENSAEESPSSSEKQRKSNKKGPKSKAIASIGLGSRDELDSDPEVDGSDLDLPRISGKTAPKPQNNPNNSKSPVNTKKSSAVEIDEPEFDEDYTSSGMISPFEIPGRSSPALGAANSTQLDREKQLKATIEQKYQEKLREEKQRRAVEAELELELQLDEDSSHRKASTAPVAAQTQSSKAHSTSKFNNTEPAIAKNGKKQYNLDLGASDQENSDDLISENDSEGEKAKTTAQNKNNKSAAKGKKGLKQLESDISVSEEEELELQEPIKPIPAAAKSKPAEKPKKKAASDEELELEEIPAETKKIASKSAGDKTSPANHTNAHAQTVPSATNGAPETNSHSFIALPAATAPAEPDPDLDIFGLPALSNSSAASLPSLPSQQGDKVSQQVLNDFFLDFPALNNKKAANKASEQPKSSSSSAKSVGKSSKKPVESSSEEELDLASAPVAVVRAQAKAVEAKKSEKEEKQRGGGSSAGRKVESGSGASEDSDEESERRRKKEKKKKREKERSEESSGRDKKDKKKKKEKEREKDKEKAKDSPKLKSSSISAANPGSNAKSTSSQRNALNSSANSDDEGMTANSPQVDDFYNDDSNYKRNKAAAKTVVSPTNQPLNSNSSTPTNSSAPAHAKKFSLSNMFKRKSNSPQLTASSRATPKEKSNTFSSRNEDYDDL
jgi:GTPase SAR1 family protein